MKKRKKTNYKKKADKLWSQVIRQKGVCDRCGKQGAQFNAHHITSRSNHSLRFDLKNGLCLCVSCHFWIHQNLVLGAEWLKSENPKTYEYLMKEKNLIKQLKQYDYEKIIIDLQGRLK